MAGLMALAVTPRVGGQELDFLVSPGPLAEVHSELAGLLNCSQCHTPGKGAEVAKCLDCHQDLVSRIQAGRGLHRDKGDECFSCHLEHQGGEVNFVSWNPDAFDHAETGRPLEGLHLEVDSCDRCHLPALSPPREKTKSFFLNDTRCIACHADEHNGQLGADCLECHSTDISFKEISFDHDRTAYPLRGPHRGVACEKCHLEKRWKGLRFSNCIDCHADPHKPSLGDDCLRCHRGESWSLSSYDHNRTRYPLIGMHRGLDCEGCHPKQAFKNIAFARCDDCHRSDPHAGQFAIDCEGCHNLNGFKPTLFAHEQSDYSLTEKHASVECSKCHLREEGRFPTGVAEAVRYKPLDTVCRACHQDVHLGQFAGSCEACHTTAGFHLDTLLFQHDRDSRYKLEGKHLDVVCVQCHQPEEGTFPIGVGQAVRYRPLLDTCAACHENVHDPAWRDPGRPRLGAQCEQCHNTETFTLSDYDHDRSSFRLDGKHKSLDCEGCHEFVHQGETRFLLFQQLPGGCADCHRSPHTKRLSLCVSCHSTHDWRVSTW